MVRRVITFLNCRNCIYASETSQGALFCGNRKTELVTFDRCPQYTYREAVSQCDGCKNLFLTKELIYDTAANLLLCGQCYQKAKRDIAGA